MILKGKLSVKVTEYYICYFDILGYKDLIKNLGENEFLQIVDKVVQETNKIINRRIKFPDEILQLEYRIFSDNILMCYHIPSEASIDKDDYYYYFPGKKVNYSLLYLGILMEQTISLQRIFIEKYSILIRGVITTGTLYFSEDYVYGQGLIDAYQLENNIAKFPRIILSNKILDILFTYDAEVLRFNRIPKINKVVDDIYFLDYLHEMNDYFLELHSILIKNGLAKYSNQNRVLEKYEWCKIYHNQVCYTRQKEEYVI